MPLNCTAYGAQPLTTRKGQAPRGPGIPHVMSTYRETGFFFNDYRNFESIIRSQITQKEGGRLNLWPAGLGGCLFAVLEARRRRYRALPPGLAGWRSGHAGRADSRLHRVQPDQESHCFMPISHAVEVTSRENGRADGRFHLETEGLTPFFQKNTQRKILPVCFHAYLGNWNKFG